jgi:hypothetical protein
MLHFNSTKLPENRFWPVPGNVYIKISKSGSRAKMGYFNPENGWKLNFLLFKIRSLSFITTF